MTYNYYKLKKTYTSAISYNLKFDRHPEPITWTAIFLFFEPSQPSASIIMIFWYVPIFIFPSWIGTDSEVPVTIAIRWEWAFTGWLALNSLQACIQKSKCENQNKIILEFVKRYELPHHHLANPLGQLDNPSHCAGKESQEARVSSEIVYREQHVS